MHDAKLRLHRAATLELVPDRNVRRVIGVLAFVIATALGARIAVPAPFTPVPVTLQTLFVLLSGALLGPALGAASQIAYLGLGAVGVPVFAGGFGLAYLLGPTGGYLLAFPATAFLAGVVARRAPSGALAVPVLFVGLFLASLVTLGGGTAWLAVLTGDTGGAVALGFVPFLVGDLLKVGLAALLAWRVRDRTLGLL
jgi:biotin transport system substrate-specific component